jgi:hypothetical protein
MRKLFVLAVAILCGCGKMGTGTGNPAKPSGVLGPGYGPNENTRQILEAVCRKIESCNSNADQAACLQAVNTLTGFAPKLGVKITPAPSGLALQYMEGSGQIDANLAATINCLKQLDGLACSSPEVQSAYDPNNPDPFSGTPGVLDPSCTKVFDP